MPTRRDITRNQGLSQTLDTDATQHSVSIRNARPTAWVVNGFTLVEMLIAVVIFAIVSAIAIPAYDNYSKRGYRSEVMADLMMCAQAIERFNVMNFTYVGVTTDGAADGALDPDVCNMGSVNQDRYDVTIETTATTYVLTAVPEGVMDGDGDLTLDQAGNRTWDEGDNGLNADDMDWEE